MPQRRRVAAELADVLHSGALTILLQQFRRHIAEQLGWQSKLPELLKLGDLREHSVDAYAAWIHLQLLED
jgi:hypothetical protein